MNEQSILQQLKAFCIDKVWLVLLLTPLFVVAYIGVQQFFPSHSKRAVTPSTGLKAAVGSVEISAVELAAIVAKPIGELLAMEVYSVGSSLISTVETPTPRQVSTLAEIRPASDTTLQTSLHQLAKVYRTRKRKEAS